MSTGRIPLVRPGLFGSAAAADVRRDEFDIRNETILAHGIPVDAVFMGDSIMQNWDLQAYFGAGGRYIVNRGISGDVSGHALRRIDADVLQLKPRLAVIKIGINNFWALDGWTAADRKAPEFIIEAITRDVREMARKTSAQHILTVICSILPTHMPFSGSDAVRNQAVRRTNTILRAIAGECGALYADYHAKMVNEDGTRLRDGLADDGLHPHVLGYDIMARELRETLAGKAFEL